MTAALEGGEWWAARPGRTLPPGKTRYRLYRRLGGPQGRSGRAENLVPTGIRSRTAQPVAQSLYRLSYPAHICWTNKVKFWIYVVWFINTANKFEGQDFLSKQFILVSNVCHLKELRQNLISDYQFCLKVRETLKSTGTSADFFPEILHNLEFSVLEMKETRLYQKSVIFYPTQQCHISEGTILHSYCHLTQM